MEIRRRQPAFAPQAKGPQSNAKAGPLRLPDPRFNSDPIDKLIALFQAMTEAKNGPRADAAANEAIHGPARRAGMMGPEQAGGTSPAAANAMDPGTGSMTPQEGSFEMVEGLVDKLREDLKRSQTELANMKRAEAKRRAEAGQVAAPVNQKP
ncbi:MAG TPA: hypothetical protein VK447_21325 [Myxococcaceae bacterium]|nr:hypothetical protein [Myxococcaceae bacterium]